jgi:1-acyl-sn-glycerol-3-phosphate acyltransferase
VIPVAIVGTYGYFTKMRVSFGEPVDLSEYHDKKIKSAMVEEVTQKIMVKVEEMING